MILQMPLNLFIFRIFLGFPSVIHLLASAYLGFSIFKRSRQDASAPAPILSSKPEWVAASFIIVLLAFVVAWTGSAKNGPDFAIEFGGWLRCPNCVCTEIAPSSGNHLTANDKMAINGLLNSESRLVKNANLNKIMELYHEDSVITDSSGKEWRGCAAIKAYYRRATVGVTFYRVERMVTTIDVPGSQAAAQAVTLICYTGGSGYGYRFLPNSDGCLKRLVEETWTLDRRGNRWAIKSLVYSEMPIVNLENWPEGIAVPDSTIQENINQDMVFIPAGSFQMGCDPAHNGSFPCEADELPLHTVTLDAFLIDRYEVTNAQYVECVRAGGCAPQQTRSSRSRIPYYNVPAYASYPVLNISWENANRYCQWAGKRLPGEAEWEKAARGSAGPRAYPWGDSAPHCDLANYKFLQCSWDTTTVGSFQDGSSPYGVMDMAGNVSEWVNDWYQADYYSISPSGSPQGPPQGSQKIVRGGSMEDPAKRLRVASRRPISPDHAGNQIGFRCAASANSATLIDIPRTTFQFGGERVNAGAFTLSPPN